MRTCLAIFTLLLVAQGHAQAFHKDWSKIVATGSIMQQRAIDVAVDGAGNIYFLGAEEGTNGGDYIIAKLDTNGNKQWLVTLNSTGSVKDVPVALGLDAVGNVYATGTSGGSRAFTAKYSSSGVFQWANSFFGSGSASADDLAVDSAGNCFISGTTLSDRITSDGVVFRINPDGSFAWFRIESLKDEGVDSGRGIVLRQGFVYTCGTMHVSSSDSDIYAAKYSVDGTTAWLRRLVLPYADQASAQDIDITEDGTKLVVVGRWRRFGSSAADPNSMSAGGAWFNESDGAVIQPSGLPSANVGTIPFSPQAGLARSVKVGREEGFPPQVVAFATYEGTMTDPNRWVIGAFASYPKPQSGVTVFPLKSWALAAAPERQMGDMAIESAHSRIGFAVGTVYSTNAAAFNLFVQRAVSSGPYAAEFQYISPHSNKRCAGVAIAVDNRDDVIVVGNELQPNGVDAILVMKLIQRPGIMPDAYHMSMNQELTVSAQDGVKRNDCGSGTATVVRTQESPATIGTLNLAADGSFFYVPPVDFSGNDVFNYKLSKAPFGDVEPDPTTSDAVHIYIYPAPNSMEMPSQLIGGVRTSVKILLDGIEPMVTRGSALKGEVSCSPEGLVLARSGWRGTQGTGIGSVTLDPQAVTANTPVTISVTRLGGIATGTTVLKPGPGILSVTFDPATVIGGDTVVGRVTLAAPAPSGGKNIFLKSTSGSISVPGQIQISAGFASQTFTVQTTAIIGGPFVRSVIAQDAPFDQQFNVVTTKSGDLTIKEPPALASLSLGSTSIHGGQSTNALVTLEGPSPSSGSVVNLSTNSGSITVPSSVTVPGGSTSRSFIVTTLQVGVTATRLVFAGKGSVTKSAPLTIVPSPTLTAFALSNSVCTGGESLTGALALSAAPSLATGVRVALADNSSAITIPSSVLVPKGSSNATFAISTSAVPTSATRAIAASVAGTTITRSLTLHPVAQLTLLEVTPNTVKGGQSVTGKITVSHPAGISGAAVSLSDNSSAITVPASATALNGATTRTFTITTSTVLVTSPRTITATRLSVTRTASLTLTP